MVQDMIKSAQKEKLARLNVPDEHRAHLEWAENFAVTEVAERAAEYDRAATIPDADIDKLWERGLLLSNVPQSKGGMGFGLDAEEPLSFLYMIQSLAHGSSSTAHCYQVHGHTVQIIDLLGVGDQVERYLKPTRESGKLLVAIGSEPGRTARGQFGLLSRAKKTKGGYIVNGLKNYATNATRAGWILIQVLEEGEEDITKGLLQFMVPADAPGMTIDAESWDPVGMRACVSPVVKLKDVFVPDEDMLGEPGKYVSSGWASKAHLAFSSNFLGSAQAMIRFAQAYVIKRGIAEETHTQMLLGELVSIASATEELLVSAAETWKRGDELLGASLSNQVKIMAHRTLSEVLDKVPHLCGSSSLFPKYPLERYMRDMHLHILHDRIEKAKAAVGASTFGLETNFSLQR